MSEMTEDLKSLFKENQEAVFFDKIDDFGKKLDNLLNNENKLKRISKNGKFRVWADGHDVDSRVKYILEKIKIFERQRNANNL